MPLISCYITNKTPKVVSEGCIGLWEHNGVLSEFGKIRETGKMCRYEHRLEGYLYGLV